MFLAAVITSLHTTIQCDLAHLSEPLPKLSAHSLETRDCLFGDNMVVLDPCFTCCCRQTAPFLTDAVRSGGFASAYCDTALASAELEITQMNVTDNRAEAAHDCSSESQLLVFYQDGMIALL